MIERKYISHHWLSPSIDISFWFKNNNKNNNHTNNKLIIEIPPRIYLICMATEPLSYMVKLKISSNDDDDDDDEDPLKNIKCVCECI